MNNSVALGYTFASDSQRATNGAVVVAVSTVVLATVGETQAEGR